MAVIKPGPTISKIAGAAGNKVYSSWKGRAVLRSKAKSRSNPGSARQATARAGTASLAKAWETQLTDEGRALWNQVTENFTAAIDSASSREPGSRQVIPQPKPVLSGYDAFIRANQRAIMTEIAPIGNPILTPSREFPNPVTDLEYVPGAPVPVTFGLDFDGVNEDVTLGNVLGYNYTAPFAWEFWVWVDSYPGSTRFIAKMEQPVFKGYYILWSGGSVYWHIRRGVGTAEILGVFRAVTLTGGWNHIICTYDGSNTAAGMHIYYNSVVGQNVQWNNAILGSIVSTEPLTFASWNADAGSWLDGRMDCIRNFNRNLIQADVNILWNGGLGLYGGDPLADGRCKGSWPACTGAGNTLFDISGLNFHGTLRNMEPGDWVLGKVPCPGLPGPDQVQWTTPTVPVGSQVRIWLLSYDAHVHKQHVATVDSGVGFWVPDTVRVAGGAQVDIASMPGHYLIQADIVDPNGNQSPPSNTIEITIP